MKLNAPGGLVWRRKRENWRLLAGLGNKLGNLAATREESSMSTADQNTQRPSVQQKIQQKLEELAELVAEQEYGPDGPGKDLTFREIEEVGYRVGQLAAQKFESAVTNRHQQHFDENQACPQCGQACPPQETVERRLLTRLGRCCR